MNFIDKINEKRIHKKVDLSLNSENVNYVDESLTYLNSELNNIVNINGEEQSKLNGLIINFSTLTSFNYIYNADTMQFYVNSNSEKIVINYQNGKFVMPKMTATNSVYLNIVKKYSNMLNEIAIQYGKIKPFLKKYNELKKELDIVSGKKLYAAYNIEYNYNRLAKDEVKIINKKIITTKEKIFSKTGWYFIDFNLLGMVDVDNNVINAVVFQNKWQPYSQDINKQEKEKYFIMHNYDLLEQYKNEYKKLIKIETRQLEIEDNINQEIINRNNIIQEIKNKRENTKQLVK